MKKRRRYKKPITLDQFKDKFTNLIQRSVLKGGITYDEYDRMILYSKQVRLSEKERTEFNTIMKKIKLSGCVHYVIPKSSHHSVHTVPNRIG